MFVKLSENQDEIDAVLLHEMGHIVHRHSLQMVIEGAFVATLLMLITGDSGGAADLGLSLGTLMISSKYSRNHESEADLYAFEQMLVAGIDPKAFSNIMTRITNYMEVRDEDKPIEKEDDSPLDYISSHPSTHLRVEQADRYSECFRKGLTKCDIEPAK